MRFEHVKFGYNAKKTVLQDITLYAKPGQKIAFVGSTGAGKTTITNLINRFYDVQDGKIRYDGININKIKKDDLRRSLGIVLQDTHLFTGTVEDNIRYGNLDATHEQIVEAAKLANADDFITRLPQGYDTHLGKQVYLDGVELSGGQTQRLMLARALYKDGAFLVLDEPTAALDPIAESDIYQKYNEMTAGKSSVFISHRLASTRFCDRILFIKDGGIAEEGTHEELLEQPGIYQDFVNIRKSAAGWSLV